MMRRHILTAILILAGACTCGAQKFSVHTNVLDWANFGTINGGCTMSVSQHVSLDLSARYNAWSFGDKEEGARYLKNRKRSAALGMRVWPWSTMSSWWFGLRAQGMEYDFGGILKDFNEAGWAYGGGLSAGYSYLLNPHWNLDVGFGLWGGRKIYQRYDCAWCGRSESGDRWMKGWFIAPDDFHVTFAYVF